jgi:hypothetical protein
MYERWKKDADDRCRYRRPHNRLATLPCETRPEIQVKIRLNSSLDLSKINSLALMAGDDPNDVAIRGLLSEKSLLKFLNCDVMSSYLDRTQNYSPHQVK